MIPVGEAKDLLDFAIDFSSTVAANLLDEERHAYVAGDSESEERHRRILEEAYACLDSVIQQLAGVTA